MDVIAAYALGGHRLYLRFQDGVSGEIDLKALVDFKGVFESLTDPEAVARVRVDADLGTVCWENGADIDPDVLYWTLTGRPVPNGLPESRGRIE